MTGDERRARAAALLRAPLGIQVMVRISEEAGCGGSGELAAERLYELVVECVVDLTPHAPDYRERVRALLARGPSLQRCAEQLLEAPSAADWFADLDRQQQTWISRDGRPPPGATEFRTDLRPFGAGAPKPREALWTSSAFGRCPSGWIPYLRRGEDHRSPPYHPWRLEVLSEARVCEIRGPEAWQALCRAFPATKSHGALDPNWEAVAQVWDGVHLSVGGLLTTQGVIANGRGAWAPLAGWDVECTVWLRWAFGSAQRLPDAS